MKRAQHGSTVSIQYIGTLDNGRIFDSRTEDELLVFTIGTNEVFPALEQAVVGMATGEAKNIVIPAAEAFGPRLAENIIKVERTEFPPGREIKVGQKLRVGFAAGVERVLLVTEVDETMVTLDGNHPLAGLDLTFALKLVAID
ncbi:peptidyl-prolyl cis-trans isomerase [Geotalea uraniireducens]|uniref:Peptidyl-prolyl cis-trans isomerase n=1 Tax=Geotalea uraniireducens TaxID=351604 RepID=A0ABN6VWP2_9BACT|nr:FKBP-type peptidyl-prolyl cis-trans isomerase [Geotalea uraniireducens]BDV44829.1 peptidyl-prolyl cis-trans isomerase [Geotalea uraniireducens]